MKTAKYPSIGTGTIATLRYPDFMHAGLVPETNLWGTFSSTLATGMVTAASRLCTAGISTQTISDRIQPSMARPLRQCCSKSSTLTTSSPALMDSQIDDSTRVGEHRE